MLAPVLLKEANKSNLEALYQLFTRLYWNRVWVKQEFGLPPELMIGCGSEFMNGDNLPRASEFLHCA